MATINPATQSYVDALVAARKAEYAKVRTYRDYADGDHQDYMTDEQRILLVGEDGAGNPNTAPELRINISTPILDAETDRLEVKNIAVTVEDNEALSDELSGLVWDRWQASRMDEGQQNVHFGACRDANSYIVDYWDDKSEQVRLAFNRAYDGDSSGTEMLYQDDDPNQPICAVKIWTVQRPVVGNASVGRVQRKNVYYEDHVEKWINTNAEGVFSAAAWRPLQQGDPDWEDGLLSGTFTDAYGNQYAAAFQWWTDTGQEGGEPLGIPVFHFRHQGRGSAYGRSTLADVVPGVQDSINIASLSLLAATVLNGSKVTTATNFDPSSTSTLSVYPGAILYNTQDGTFGQLSETDLRQLIEVKDSLIKDAATLTSTPLSFFNLTGVVPAEGTQKQLEISLLAKTRRNQTSFGNSYEDAVRMLLKLEAVYGSEVTLSLEDIDALDISVEWEDANPRNEAEVLDGAIRRHKELQTPREVAWSEAGYSPDEIEAMREDLDTRRNQAMGELLSGLMEAENAQDVPPNGAPVAVQEQERGLVEGNAGQNPNGRTDSAASAAGARGA